MSSAGEGRKNDEAQHAILDVEGTIVVPLGQRPLEALSFFLDVVNHHSIGPYPVAARPGIAESLAMLERHNEAVDAYRIAIEELDSLGGTRLVNADVLRVALGLMAQGQRAFRQDD